jgi:hypothetical protein
LSAAEAVEPHLLERIANSLARSLGCVSLAPEGKTDPIAELGLKCRPVDVHQKHGANEALGIVDREVGAYAALEGHVVCRDPVLGVLATIGMRNTCHRVRYLKSAAELDERRHVLRCKRPKYEASRGQTRPHPAIIGRRALPNKALQLPWHSPFQSTSGRVCH